MDTIRKEVDWNKQQGISSWRFDCQIHALGNYMTRKIMGFTEKDELYSKWIREGMITRDEALRKADIGKETEGEELKVMEKVFDKLELTTKERECVLNLKVLD